MFVFNTVSPEALECLYIYEEVYSTRTYNIYAHWKGNEKPEGLWIPANRLLTHKADKGKIVYANMIFLIESNTPYFFFSLTSVRSLYQTRECKFKDFYVKDHLDI